MTVKTGQQYEGEDGVRYMVVLIERWNLNIDEAVFARSYNVVLSRVVGMDLVEMSHLKVGMDAFPDWLKANNIKRSK